MRWLVLVITAGLCCSLARSEEDYHMFTDITGREISARILTYDSRKQNIRVEMGTGRQGNILLSQLSDADQEYVRQWQVGRDFMQDRRFVISAKRKCEDNEEKTRKYGVITRDVENMSYEILLENKSEMMFENIKMQYCIYYEQEESVTGGNETRQGVYCGEADIESLTAGSKQKLKTDAVLIYKAELDSGYYYTAGSDSSQDGAVRGIWVKFTMEMPGGDKVVRDFCMPDSIPNGHTWTTRSVKVGMN